MDDIITQVQALQTSDDAALQAIVTALQAVKQQPPTCPTAVSVVITMSDGTQQSVPPAPPQP